MMEFFLTLGMSFILALLPFLLILMPLGAFIEMIDAPEDSRVIGWITVILTGVTFVAMVVIFVMGMLTLV